MSSSHPWHFFRAGGVDQVRLDAGADLLALDGLDPKNWLALACPTQGLEFDERALRLFDMDGDGRVKMGDLIVLVRFLRPLLKDPAVLVPGKDALPLGALNESTPEGKSMLEAARAALSSLGKQTATELTTADATAAQLAFEKARFNGDGILPPDAAEDPEVKRALEDMVSTLGGEMGADGKLGVGTATLEAFFTEASAFLAWQAEGDAAEVRPLGDDTAEAYARYEAVAAKVDDFFTRCRAAAFDPRAAAAFSLEEKHFAALAEGQLSADAKELAAFPLAKVGPDASLPLRKGVNPAFAEALARFADAVVQKVVGQTDTLDYAQWLKVKAHLAPHLGWVGKARGTKVQALGRARVQALVDGDLRARVQTLIAEDKAFEPAAKEMTKLERLVISVRYLHEFCNNFVNFRDFYRQERKAMFQMGTLYLDRRSCDLCLEVTNVAAHVGMASLARAYLVYCDLTRKVTGAKKTIVAAMTAGDSDNLMVGRNGLFVDRHGDEWDATIVRIVDNPISVRQAFWSPYKKLIRFIEEQVAKRAAEKEAASSGTLTSTASGVLAAADAPPPPPSVADKTPKKFDVGVVAALGVAVGGLTAALGALLTAFFGLGLWMPLGFVGLLLAISGPSMLVAWLKLRQRNLGPLLDANGWAVNALARVNVPLGGALTKEAKLPEGAARDLVDPFEEGRRPWLPWLLGAVLAVLLVLWGLGRLDPWMPEPLQAGRVFGWAEAPPPEPPPPPVPAP